MLTDNVQPWKAGLYGRAQAEALGEADEAAVWVLRQELPHAGFAGPGPIPVLLRLQEQRPARGVQAGQDGRHVVHGDLEVDPAPERPLQGRRDPAPPGRHGLLQHDLPAGPVEKAKRSSGRS